jgi:hypothetical protein
LKKTLKLIKPNARRMKLIMLYTNNDNCPNSEIIMCFNVVNHTYPLTGSSFFL